MCFFTHLKHFSGLIPKMEGIRNTYQPYACKAYGYGSFRTTPQNRRRNKVLRIAKRQIFCSYLPETFVVFFWSAVFLVGWWRLGERGFHKRSKLISLQSGPSWSPGRKVGTQITPLVGVSFIPSYSIHKGWL